MMAIADQRVERAIGNSIIGTGGRGAGVALRGNPPRPASARPTLPPRADTGGGRRALRARLLLTTAGTVVRRPKMKRAAASVW